MAKYLTVRVYMSNEKTYRNKKGEGTRERISVFYFSLAYILRDLLFSFRLIIYLCTRLYEFAASTRQQNLFPAS